MPPIPSTLEDAYRATRYEVSLDGRVVVIRIGERCDDLNDYCNKHSVKSWVFITACNPLSRVLPEVENRRRQRLLEALLCEGGYDFVAGEGIGEAGDWPPEPSFLVFGMDLEKALAFGFVFDQNAIVYGEPGDIARLSFCDL